MGNEPDGPWYHDDLQRFRDSLRFTEAESGFSARLIEKDYFCTLILRDPIGAIREIARFQRGHLPEQSPRTILSLE